MTYEDDNPFDMYEIGRNLKHLESTNGKAAVKMRDWRIELANKRKALREATAYATEHAPAGTVPEKKAYVDSQTSVLQYEVELAKIQVDYATDILDERSSTRSSLQSRLKAALETMRLAGYGEGA
jgi:hypothetical protein